MKKLRHQLKKYPGTEENQDNNCIVSEILNNKCKNESIGINQLDEIKNSLLNDDYNGENTIIETETVVIQLSRLDGQANRRMKIYQI